MEAISKTWRLRLPSISINSQNFHRNGTTAMAHNIQPFNPDCSKSFQLLQLMWARTLASNRILFHESFDPIKLNMFSFSDCCTIVRSPQKSYSRYICFDQRQTIRQLLYDIPLRETDQAYNYTSIQKNLSRIFCKTSS